jgi:hypothetical protein
MAMAERTARCVWQGRLAQGQGAVTERGGLQSRR